VADLAPRKTNRAKDSLAFFQPTAAGVGKTGAAGIWLMNRFQKPNHKSNIDGTPEGSGKINGLSHCWLTSQEKKMPPQDEHAITPLEIVKKVILVWIGQS
jgi:hypothetical protein